MVVDAGEDLRFGAVAREDGPDDVHLPELHRPTPLPALIGAQHLLALALDDEAAAQERPIDRHVRGRVEAGLPQLVLDAHRSPQVVAASHVEDRHLDRALHLVGDVPWPVGLVGESLEATLFVFEEPAIDRLATHVELGRDLGDGKAVFHHHGHGVIALFHFADVL